MRTIQKAAEELVDGQNSAFPRMIQIGSLRKSIGGLTKRELFGAMAMQGLVSHPFSTDPAEAANLAVKHADALMAALEKNEDPK